MEDGNRIVVECSFKELKALDTFRDSGVKSTRELYTSFMGWPEIIQRIQFEDQAELITLDISNGVIGKDYETSVISISKEELGSEVFFEMLDTLELTEWDYNPGRAYFNYDRKRMRAYGAAKKIASDCLYLVIFNLYDGESRKAATLYIHGIWRIRVSADVMEKLVPDLK